MITINGDQSAWTPGLTVRGVLTLKNFKFKMLVIKVDDVLVQPKDYDTTAVPDGAAVNVLHLISGG